MFDHCMTGVNPIPGGMHGRMICRRCDHDVKPDGGCAAPATCKVQECRRSGHDPVTVSEALRLGLIR